jgi:hypothetical protein
MSEMTIPINHSEAENVSIYPSGLETLAVFMAKEVRSGTFHPVQAITSTGIRQI